MPSSVWINGDLNTEGSRYTVADIPALDIVIAQRVLDELPLPPEALALVQGTDWNQPEP